MGDHVSAQVLAPSGQHSVEQTQHSYYDNPPPTLIAVHQTKNQRLSNDGKYETAAQCVKLLLQVARS